jgi:bidirectional [NiFe] hydrogenase diaphorase subunit
MSTQAAKARKKAPHPSGDERYKAIDMAMRKFKYEKDALLEVLNAAQETFGYLSRDNLIYISNQLGVRMAQVYGVATFYHLFTFDPLGAHSCIICTGTACHVKGSGEIVESLSKHFDVPEGQTTPDGLFSLLTARCVGSCGIAPVVIMDGKVRGKEAPQSMVVHVQDVLDRERLSEAEAG